MNVVSFLAPRPRHPKWRQDYGRCLDLQRRWCERYGYRHIVVTDAPGAIEELGCAAFHADLPVSLMPATLAGQLAYLESPAFDVDTLLTGADCLVSRAAAAVFAEDSWDIAVTTHPFADCHLNTGAIFCRKSAAPTIAALWRAALELCGDEWGDDQLALQAVLRAPLWPGVYGRIGHRLRVFSCATHNWAPERPDEPCAAAVAHFRGDRKRYMALWAERHMS
ncbi:MAG: hypothetical protein ACK4NA_12815 [Alphaproteobacteria bacterium]